MEKKKMATFQKTPMLKDQEVKHEWLLLDASGKTLGRLSSEITKILRGKHKATFTPHADGGDGVIIINADKIAVTGKKEAQKLYRHHTGFIGGLREIPFRVVLARKPRYIIEHAVKGMMPKTRLSKRQLKRLRIFAGEGHNMIAQQPTTVNI
jgi:large subunit ribosomal protein L13